MSSEQPVDAYSSGTTFEHVGNGSIAEAR